MKSSGQMSKRAQGAELDEIEAIYRRRLAELRRVATAITGSREVALDAVQDGFARAIRQRGSFRGDGSVDAWLWRVVVNAARDHARSRSEAVPLDEAAASMNGLGPSSESRQAEFHSLVAKLPERQRLVLFLRYYADLDYGTIAEALEISAGTVGATLSQARESLRELMGEVAR
jgi:RNA polymerase sigma-70 factor (ECF subfamily)